MTLREHLLSKGFDFNPERLDGQFHEYKTETKKGWYIGKTTDQGTLFTWGCWRTGEKFSCAIGWSGTVGERDQASAELEQVYRAQKATKNAKAQKRAQREWTETQNIGPSKYLLGKNLPGTTDLVKTTANSWGEADLLVPMFDENGTLWNLQRIQPDGFKSFLPGGRTEGLSLAFPGTDENLVYVCEGFATAFSVWLALGSRIAVLCAFSAKNMPAIAKQAAKKWKEVVIAADNDKSKVENVGLLVAKECATLVDRITFPTILSLGSDFNDLWQENPDQVGQQLLLDRTDELIQLLKGKQMTKQDSFNNVEQAPVAATTDTNKASLTAPSGEIVELSTKRKIPPESEVAKILFDMYGSDMVRYGKDMFRWVGTHWKHVTDDEKVSMTHEIQQLEPTYGSKKAQATLDTFHASLALATHDMWAPNPWRVNLANGTLHILKNDGAYSSEWKPHDKRDFCTNLIPITFDPIAKNQAFLDIIEKVIAGDDSDGKRIAIQEMYGACLAPIFPRLFMLWGPQGTGKSSIITPLQELMNKENISFLGPTDLKAGPLLESAVGKLVNMDTDVKYDALIEDSVIKKIEDRIPQTINRKYKTAIQAPLPAVHVFGGNDIPGTIDRGSRAHERRWTFIGFTNNVLPADGGLYDRDFSAEVFRQNASGVLNFALDGLKRLLERKGIFTQPVSGKVKMKEWLESNDVMALFMRDIAEGEVRDLVLGEDLKVERVALWEAFKNWHSEARNGPPRFGKNKFYEALGSRNLVQGVQVQGVRCFKGLGLRSGLM
jgi:phage/plasmid primase-like uncharacterized protein